MSNIHLTSARRKAPTSEHQAKSTRGAAVAWHERPNLTVDIAADILGCSRAKIYKLAKSGELAMTQNHATGRTSVTTASVLAVLSLAQPYTPQGTDPRGAALTKQRRRDGGGGGASSTATKH
jgi:excisionase family DNA binding protein